MSQFETGKIILQPGDVIGYAFKFPIAESATSNTGALPYGRTISSVAVTAYDADGEVATDDLIEGTPSLDTVTVTVVLKYPGTDGRYSLRFIITLDNGWTKECDFTTIYAKNI